MRAAMTNSIWQSPNSGAPRQRRSFAAPIWAALCALTLAACDRTVHHEPHLLASNYEERHKIEVVKKTETISLALPRGSSGLSAHQQGKVSRFLAAYTKNPQGDLMIAAPSGASNETATIEALKQIRKLTRNFRIPAAAIRLRPYFAGDRNAPPIRMFFEKNVAIAPNCPDWSDNLARDRRNLHFRNYGCATQKNLANMVANPRDLIEPRGTNPKTRPSDRRDVVFDKYRSGQTTSATRSQEESAGISELAKQ